MAWIQPHDVKHTSDHESMNAPVFIGGYRELEGFDATKLFVEVPEPIGLRGFSEIDGVGAKGLRMTVPQVLPSHAADVPEAVEKFQRVIIAGSGESELLVRRAVDQLKREG